MRDCHGIGVPGPAEDIFESMVKEKDIIEKHGPSNSAVQVSVGIVMKTCGRNVGFRKASRQQREICFGLDDERWFLLQAIQQAINMFVHHAAIRRKYGQDATPAESPHIAKGLAQQVSFPA